MEKDFDLWNKVKKKIDNKYVEETLFIKEGEVWMMNMGLNIGYEQNGNGENFSRPGLIIKKFNRKMFWAIPLSTKQKNFDFYYNFRDPLHKNVSLILAQIKLCSVKRLQRKLYDIEDSTLLDVVNKIKDLF